VAADSSSVGPGGDGGARLRRLRRQDWAFTPTRFDIYAGKTGYFPSARLLLERQADIFWTDERIA
jgi:hypothetical protein